MEEQPSRASSRRPVSPNGWLSFVHTVFISLLVATALILAAPTVLHMLERIIGRPGEQTWLAIEPQWPPDINEQSFVELLMSAKRTRHHKKVDFIILQLTGPDSWDEQRRQWQRSVINGIMKQIGVRADLIWTLFACGCLDREDHFQTGLVASLLAEQRRHGDILAVRAQSHESSAVLLLSLQLLATELEFQYVLVKPRHMLPLPTFVAGQLNLSDLSDASRLEVYKPGDIGDIRPHGSYSIRIHFSLVRQILASAFETILTADENRANLQLMKVLHLYSPVAAKTMPVRIVEYDPLICSRRDDPDSHFLDITGAFFKSPFPPVSNAVRKVLSCLSRVNQQPQN